MEQIPSITIAGRKIGPGLPVYIVAEVSCNHRGSFEKALALIQAAKEAGADAVKLQTYTADTITLNCDNRYFRIEGDNTWAGRTLHALYEETHTPWQWQPKLLEAAKKAGITLFSSPFDPTAVAFLEQLNMPAYKVASFELIDIPLIQCVAKTNKPVILSTGLGSFSEIAEAVSVVRACGNNQVAVLKCTSDYPAKPQDIHLSSIKHLQKALHVPVGLSDHSLGSAVAIGAAALGACIIEKHLILSHADGGPDGGFSMDVHEFKAMVAGIREIEQAIGDPEAPISAAQERNRIFRRSLFIVQDIQAGEMFTESNIRSIRPGHGLAPKYLPLVLGKHAAGTLKKGEPLRWEHVSHGRTAEKKDAAEAASRR